jgi:hypothetical protein
MRRWIALLLLLTLPWPTLASAGSWSMPCAMGGEAMVADAPADTGDGGMAEASDDCCNDFATWARTGLVCQAGTVCVPASVWPALATVSLGLSSPPAWPAPPWLARPSPRFNPSGIWRPPTAG